MLNLLHTEISTNKLIKVGGKIQETWKCTLAAQGNINKGFSDITHDEMGDDRK